MPNFGKKATTKKGKKDKPKEAPQEKIETMGGPTMGHEPKMEHKPKSAGLEALARENPELEYVGKAKMKDIRAKMAHPKMNDDKNFPKMAQDMAKALIPPMDGAKMYKPTKYHDGPKMGHEPKMGHKPKMGHEPKMGHKPKAYHDKK